MFQSLLGSVGTNCGLLGHQFVTPLHSLPFLAESGLVVPRDLLPLQPSQLGLFFPPTYHVPQALEERKVTSLLLKTTFRPHFLLFWNKKSALLKQTFICPHILPSKVNYFPPDYSFSAIRNFGRFFWFVLFCFAFFPFFHNYYLNSWWLQ